MNNEETHYDYKSLIVGVIIAGGIAFLAQLLIKHMLVTKTYSYTFQGQIFSVIFFIPLVLQIVLSIVFPVSYHRLIKSGQHEHKLSHILVPEVFTVLLLVVQIVLTIVW
jgi:hypothetical protein